MVENFTPKTVEEFIDYYSNELKTQLEVYNIQINKVGFLGFLLNILGHTNYDLKNYYDFLFRESFISTAETSENIHLHASVYGYFPSFASAAKMHGNIEFDFNLLPSKQNDVIKREVYLNSPKQLLVFESNGYKFSTKSAYKLIWENNQYKTIITTSSGESIQYPSASSIIEVPLVDSFQYFQDEIIFKSTNYPANSFYSYPFEIEDGFMSNIQVFVKEKNATEEEEYEVKYVKYLETGSSKTVFLRKITQTEYVLELGSGLRGKWLPQADIRMVLNITKGEEGNFLSLDSSPQQEPQQIILLDFNSDGEIVSTFNLDAAQLVKLNVEASDGGKDPLTDIQLRDEVIKYIQTRDNLVSEVDFYNVAQKYETDFKFLFKKIQVFDNVFYLCRTFRNKYQTVIFSDNHSVKLVDFTEHYHPVFVINNKEFISPFLYVYNDILNWFDGYLLNENFMVYLNSIEVTDQVSSSYNVPPIYFNVQYDRTNSLSRIQLKSYQDISSLSFKITIDELHIFEEDLTPVDSNTFEYIYTEDNGIIFDKFSISLDVYESSVKVFIAQVDEIYQVYNITDLLNLTRFRYNLDDYIVNIPVIDKEEFDSDQQYYIQQLNDFIIGNRFEENRMVSDNLQFRFLNNYTVFSQYLDAITVQGKDIFGNIENWLSDAVTIASDPPSTVENDDKFLVGENPTGDFIGHENEIATFYGLPEITKIICNDANTLSGGEYFVIHSINDDYYVWYNIDVSSTDPAPTGLVGIEVNINTADDSNIVADKTASNLSIHPDFTASFENNEVTLTTNDLGVVPNSNDFNTGFVITTEQEGVDSHYEFYIPQNYDGIKILDTRKLFYFDSEWIEMILKLPLILNVEIKVDENYIRSNNIDLFQEKENLVLQLADLLQKNYSTTNLICYNSQIIDFVHDGRQYVKSAKVTIRDSNNTIIPNGLEIEDDRTILENLKDNKYNIVNYTPVYWHWNLDQIELITLIE